jgi:hypothetical protein
VHALYAQSTKINIFQSVKQFWQKILHVQLHNICAFVRFWEKIIVFMVMNFLFYTRATRHTISQFFMKRFCECVAPEDVRACFFVLFKKNQNVSTLHLLQFLFRLIPTITISYVCFWEKIEKKPWICRWKINQTLNYESWKLAVRTLQSQSILNLGFVSSGICWCGKSNLKIWWHGKSNQGVISFSFVEHRIFFSSFFSLTFLRGTGHDGRSHGHTASEDCRRRSGRPHRKNHWEGRRA